MPRPQQMNADRHVRFLLIKLEAFSGAITAKEGTIRQPETKTVILKYVERRYSHSPGLYFDIGEPMLTKFDTTSASDIIQDSKGQKWVAVRSERF